MDVHVNNFQVDLWKGGYPVWCELRHGNDYQTVIRFTHNELRDLQYAIEAAMRKARQELPAQYREEV